MLNCGIFWGTVVSALVAYVEEESNDNLTNNSMLQPMCSTLRRPPCKLQSTTDSIIGRKRHWQHNNTNNAMYILILTIHQSFNNNYNNNNNFHLETFS